MQYIDCISAQSGMLASSLRCDTVQMFHSPMETLATFNLWSRLRCSKTGEIMEDETWQDINNLLVLISKQSRTMTLIIKIVLYLMV